MSVKSKIQNIVDAVNLKTGETDTTLTDAVQTLVDGYGQSGAGGDYDIEVVENEDGTQSWAVTDAEGGITDGIVVKARNANGYATEIDVYGSTVPIWCCGIDFHNSTYYGWGAYIEKVNLKNKVTIIEEDAFRYCKELTDTSIDLSEVEMIGSAAFQYCTRLTNVDLPKCIHFWSPLARFDTETNDNYQHAGFSGCTSLISANLPELTVLPRQTFEGCTALKSVYAPKCSDTPSRTSYGPFRNCTALETVQLGSVGFPMTSLRVGTFYGCTQSGLTITIYCLSSYANTALMNARNNATNATIIIKDSTTGETLVTSTPA